MQYIMTWAFAHPYLFTILAAIAFVMAGVGLSELPNIVAIDNNYYYGEPRDERD